MTSDSTNVFNRLLCIQLRHALRANNIEAPTPVQTRAIPLILAVSFADSYSFAHFPFI